MRCKSGPTRFIVFINMWITTTGTTRDDTTKRGYILSQEPPDSEKNHCSKWYCELSTIDTASHSETAIFVVYHCLSHLNFVSHSLLFQEFRTTTREKDKSTEQRTCEKEEVQKAKFGKGTQIHGIKDPHSTNKSITKEWSKLCQNHYVV